MAVTHQHLLLLAFLLKPLWRESHRPTKGLQFRAALRAGAVPETAGRRMASAGASCGYLVVPEDRVAG